MIFRSDLSTTELRSGCVLATIAHAIFTVHHPELANEQSWDGFNYNVQDLQGSLGTVTFAEDGTVGAFFNSHSQRNPFSSGERYDGSARLAEMPGRLRALAETETLQYLIQEYGGVEVPVVTAVFWSEYDRLVAAEPWPDVLSNGGHLVQVQLQATDQAIEAWRAYYSLTPAQAELLGSIFRQKMASSGAPLVLRDPEKGLLLEQGVEGLEQSRELLASVGITLP